MDDRPDSWPHPVASSEMLIHLRSAFQAHASCLPSSTSASTTGPTDVERLIDHLEQVFPRVKRRTHAMWAWRAALPPSSSTSTSDSRTLTSSSIPSGNYDGGESGAGERLARLLELSRCEDVVLIVFRWYGGVKLGSDRWKCISDVAKQALERGEFGVWGRAEVASKDVQGKKVKGKKGKKKR